MTEFEPRINGALIRSGTYKDYNVILVGKPQEAISSTTFTVLASDDQPVTVHVTPQLAMKFQTDHEDPTFEILGVVDANCELTAQAIFPLFDKVDEERAKPFDVKLYDRLVEISNNRAFQNLFFPAQDQ